MTYHFRINNYHAISSANIRMAGITVVAGNNGSGKSTLSRWIYYVINTIADFDNRLFVDFRKHVVSLLDKYTPVVDDMATYNGQDRKKDFDKIVTIISSLQHKNGIGQVETMFAKVMELFAAMLTMYAQKETNAHKLSRVGKVLGVPDLSEASIQVFSRQVTKSFHDILAEFQRQQASHPLSYLKKSIAACYKETDDFPHDVQIDEDGVELLEDNVGRLYGISEAIYVDAPIAVSIDSPLKVHWHELLYKMHHPRENYLMTSQAKVIVDALSKMMKGTIVEHESLGISELRYRSDNGLLLKLDSVASGYRTLAYMQQLVKNGWLTDKTLLIIDEPEVNLHPSWIVEFAHLLVSLNKTLGVKILITTHNPDMVSAIRYISEQKDLLPNTSFYLAKNVLGSEQYEYKDLDVDIEPVFESFNEAFSALEQYVEGYGTV